MISHDDLIDCISRTNSAPVEDKRRLQAQIDADKAAFYANGGTHSAAVSAELRLVRSDDSHWVWASIPAATDPRKWQI